MKYNFKQIIWQIIQSETAKLPKITQIIPVFALATMLIYGWTTYRFLQKLPGWLFYLNFSEIISNYSYSLVFDFVECLIFIGAIIILNLLLPKKFFSDLFVARGACLVFLGVGYLMYLALSIGQSKSSQFPWETFNWLPAVTSAIVFVSILLPMVGYVRMFFEAIADRAIIFLYLIIPLSAIGLTIVILNNLF